MEVREAKKGRPCVFDELEAMTLVNLWNAGISMDKLAEHFHCNRTTIYRTLKRYREQNSKE